MKKVLFLLIIFIQAGLIAQADNYMPTTLQIPNNMFSTEETRPLTGLENKNYTNQAIMSIENKYSIQPSTSSKNAQDYSQQPKEKGLKSWFKGFVVEW